MELTPRANRIDDSFKGEFISLLKGCCCKTCTTKVPVETQHKVGTIYEKEEGNDFGYLQAI